MQLCLTKDISHFALLLVFLINVTQDSLYQNAVSNRYIGYL